LKTAFHPTAVRGVLAGAVGLLFSLAVLGSCAPADTGPPRTVAEGQTARIIVPLRLEDGRWLVEERISVTTPLDFVPLE
jgi:hypothetical protein